MTWKRHGEGEYRRPCPNCCGCGYEKIKADDRFTGCCCPWEGCEEVDHPSNTANNPDAKYKGVWHKIERCNKCHLFWLVYFESGDDSLDIPGPELIGSKLPKDDWRPK